MEDLPEPDGKAAERPDDDDHDLLTFGEAGVRLDQEVRKQAAAVKSLEDDPSTDPAALTYARTRLESLRDAAERNARAPISDENFAKFFGYEGKAQRNT